ncbi:RodZ domain-containing protein, partial [Nostoc sp. NIES-2111]
MQSLGMRLRQEREKRRIPLEKIAEETKISARYLEALEADDLSKLPGEFFYRAFVRQYSTYLGFDPEAVDRDINVVSSKPVIEEGVPTGSTVVPDPQISALQETLRDKPLRAAQDDGMSKAWLGFAALVILGCVAYFGWKNFTPAPEPSTQASTQASAQTAQQPVAQTTPPVSTPVTETTPPPTNTPETTTPEASTTPPPAPVETTPTPAAGQFSLTLVAKEMTWIRITADGAKVFGGTIEAGQQRTINAKDAEVIVGNAGTLDVIYNGKPLQYGVKGEVKTLLFNPEGWKYKPKPVPPPSATP